MLNFTDIYSALSGTREIRSEDSVTLKTTVLKVKTTFKTVFTLTLSSYLTSFVLEYQHLRLMETNNYPYHKAGFLLEHITDFVTFKANLYLLLMDKTSSSHLNSY